MHGCTYFTKFDWALYYKQSFLVDRQCLLTSIVELLTLPYESGEWFLKSGCLVLELPEMTSSGI